jgi:hypothetical protein
VTLILDVETDESTIDVATILVAAAEIARFVKILIVTAGIEIDVTMIGPIEATVDKEVDESTTEAKVSVIAEAPVVTNVE